MHRSVLYTPGCIELRVSDRPLSLLISFVNCLQCCSTLLSPLVIQPLFSWLIAPRMRAYGGFHHVETAYNC